MRKLILIIILFSLFLTGVKIYKEINKPDYIKVNIETVQKCTNDITIDSNITCD